MVIGVLEVFLEEVMVHILGRKLGPDARNSQGFEFQHDQGAGRVLGQCLIDFQTDLFAGPHTAFNQVTFDQLLRYVFAHGRVLL